jgi:hypothetical protein
LLTSIPLVARGITPLPKSVTATRIAENLKVVALDATDLEALNKIHQVKGVTRFVYPEFGVRYILPTRYDRSTDLLTFFSQVNLGFPDKQ